MKIPMLWTLSVIEGGNLGWRSPVDILKQLVLPVLQLVQKLLLNDQSPALNPTRFQAASTESDGFELLGAVLEGIPQA